MNKLESFSDEELRAELFRREDARKKAQIAELQSHIESAARANDVDGWMRHTRRLLAQHPGCVEEMVVTEEFYKKLEDEAHRKADVLGGPWGDISSKAPLSIRHIPIRAA